ncbi:MAG TPA: response regulator [Pirellulales bacterium]|nr:response regulator [Pirellulales bacterium]
MAADQVNILVVDDQVDKLLALEASLLDLGQRIVTATSGRDALRQLLELEFAVILLDVNMPDMDGFETAAFIRQHPRSAHTPIIFVTAYSDDMLVNHGYSLGAVDFVLAPVIPEVLRTKVGVFVELFKKTEQVKRNAEAQIALAREQAARAAAEEATRNSQFLAQASTVLAETLYTDRTLRALARHIVSFLADACAITLSDGSAQPRETEFAWCEAGAEGRSPSKVGSHIGPACSMLSAPLATAAELVLDGTEAEVRLDRVEMQFPPVEAAGDSAANAQMVAALVLPLKAHGRILGAMSLARKRSRRPFSEGEVALAQELTGRAATALENARLYQDIQENDRRKNEFLAMLAHELRNPLAPIRNAVELLRVSQLDPADVTYVRDVVERQVQQLVRLVDDLLDISRITRGKITLQKQTVDLVEIVDRAVEMSRPLIESRRHTLHYEGSHERLLVDGDPIRLTQVVSNLLNNAAKYTPDGGDIYVSLQAEGDRLAIRVRDTGIGIPPQMLGHVFELFTQVDRSLDRSQGGLGVGLTLVRRLVDMHQGTVSVHSAGPNQGSEFVVTLPALPCQVPLPQEAVPSLAVEPSRADQRKRVLVVDDNADAAMSLSMLLRMRGHATEVYYDGPSALEHAEAFRPDLVLLDIGLPGMDGYEVARCMRQSEVLRQTTLAALTGYGRAEDQELSHEAGFDHHLVKPIQLKQLDELLAQLDVSASAEPR